MRTQTFFKSDIDKVKKEFRYFIKSSLVGSRVSLEEVEMAELAMIGGLNDSQIKFLNDQVDFLIIEEDYSVDEAKEEVWERWANSLEIVKIGIKQRCQR